MNAQQRFKKRTDYAKLVLTQPYGLAVNMLVHIGQILAHANRAAMTKDDVISLDHLQRRVVQDLQLLVGAPDQVFGSLLLEADEWIKLINEMIDENMAAQRALAPVDRSNGVH